MLSFKKKKKGIIKDKELVKIKHMIAERINKMFGIKEIEQKEFDNRRDKETEKKKKSRRSNIQTM